MDFDAYASIHPDYFASRFSALHGNYRDQICFAGWFAGSAERFPFTTRALRLIYTSSGVYPYNKTDSVLF